MKAEAVHGAVPRDVEPTVTDHLNSTPAMGAVAAGGEAGLEDDDLMADNGFVVFFFTFFFTCLRLVLVPTAGRFFFFFLQHNKLRGFLGFGK
jgi:hypothetical protein